VLAAASAWGWDPALLDADGLAAWVAGELFPARARSLPAPRVGEGEVRDAVGTLGTLESIGPEGFRSRARGDDTHHRVVSLLWPPPAVAAGLLNDLPLLRPRITVSLTASALPPGRALLQLKARALIEARSTHRFNQTEMQARSEALQEVEHRVFADGERIFEMRLQVHVMEADAARADEAASLVCKALERHEIEGAVERDIGGALLLRGCLPFCAFPHAEATFHRRRRLLSRDCSDLHPAGGSWTGTPAGGAPAPAVFYANPAGEPLHLDPTRAEKNPHALIVGQSGAGKSFFVHDYLLHLWRSPRVRLFLLSIKPDYRKLALLLGRYVEITLDSDDSLNPFGGRPSLENQGRWVAALRLMLTDGEGSPPPGREADIALQEASMAAALRNWDAGADAPLRETLLEDICIELERAGGATGRALAHALLPYRRGPYRRLFNRPRTINADDRFVFFNFGSILRQPCAALASFCVFLLVDEVMADPLLRGAPKGLVADEAWALVRDPQAAAILERSLKAYRSLGGFALPIVQDPRDLDTPAGRVMLVNTATKVLLPLDAAGQADLGRFLHLNERETDIVRHLRLVKRRYSEFFVCIDGMRSAKGLLVPDPLRYAVSTTDPADEERIERFHRECGDMAGALDRFAREFPYGIPAHAA
jgi:conjugal transfer ATP-binding protein TraC